MIKLLIGVLIATILGLGIFIAIDPNNTPQQYVVDQEDPNQLSVKIEGEVLRAGTYVIEAGATMGDVIESAGGLTSNADEKAFYYEALVNTGKTYFIASKYDKSDVCSTNPIVKVDINNDDATTISSINAFNMTVATSIVSYRTENGSFQTIEQLLDVYGIGNATYNKVRNYVTLHE